MEVVADGGQRAVTSEHIIEDMIICRLLGIGLDSVNLL